MSPMGGKRKLEALAVLGLPAILLHGASHVDQYSCADCKAHYSSDGIEPLAPAPSVHRQPCPVDKQRWQREKIGLSWAVAIQCVDA